MERRRGAEMTRASMIKEKVFVTNKSNYNYVLKDLFLLFFLRNHLGILPDLRNCFERLWTKQQLQSFGGQDLLQQLRILVNQQLV